MSLNRALDTFNLKTTDKIPHTEFVSNDRFILKKTGINTKELEVEGNDNDPFENRKKLIVQSALANELDYDFIWNVYEIYTEGRVTNMGHAVWDEIDKKDDKISCPFKTTEEVLNFDPLQEYKLPDIDIITSRFRNHLKEAGKLFTDAVVTGGRYNSLFSACIRTFGWDMFLSSVPGNEKKFDRILDGFFEISLKEIKAWLKTDIKVYICHDDITWKTGAVFNPEWYRKYIFPRYKKLWAPLKDKGIKVIFYSDGKYNEFIDDIAWAGADGFGLDPDTSLEFVAEKYGKKKVIIGNADCRILQTGKKENIWAEVKRCTDIGKDCPGYFMNMGNHIPNGISIESIEYYFECFEKMRSR
jgi:hypothetical protein